MAFQCSRQRGTYARTGSRDTGFPLGSSGSETTQGNGSFYGENSVEPLSEPGYRWAQLGGCNGDSDLLCDRGFRSCLPGGLVGSETRYARGSSKPAPLVPQFLPSFPSRMTQVASPQTA